MTGRAVQSHEDVDVRYPGIEVFVTAINGPVHVLLVEDNPLDARVAMRTIDQWQTPSMITHVDDGDAALAVLHAEQSAPPNMVLLDLNLPTSTGHDVLSDIRESEHLRHIPVVILTTSSTDADVRRSYELGANAFVTKPTDLEGWRETLGTLESFWFGTASLPPAP